MKQAHPAGSPAFPEGQEPDLRAGRGFTEGFLALLAPQLLLFNSGPSAGQLGQIPTEHRTLTGPAGEERCTGKDARGIQEEDTIIQASLNRQDKRWHVRAGRDCGISTQNQAQGWSWGQTPRFMDSHLANQRQDMRSQARCGERSPHLLWDSWVGPMRQAEGWEIQVLHFLQTNQNRLSRRKI